MNLKKKKKKKNRLLLKYRIDSTHLDWAPSYVLRICFVKFPWFYYAIFIKSWQVTSLFVIETYSNS